MRYAVAKYTPDLFRKEPRNIGVFVVGDNRVALRLLGERSDCVLDLRRVPWAQQHGSTFAEWHNHWRTTVEELNHTRLVGSDFQTFALARLVDGSQNAFAVVGGGRYIPDDDGLDVEDVADLLFRRLVTGDPQVADDPEEDARGERFHLRRVVRSAFDERGLLAKRTRTSPTLIQQEAEVLGTLKVPYKPAFSQRNGRLAVMEDVDFGQFGEDKARDHALYTAHMLADIRLGQQLAGPVDLYAIVHYASERNEYAQTLGRAALEGVDGIQIINWDDMWDRERFLKIRAAAANSLH